MLFDASGIQRLISGVRASITAGRVVSEILEPLQTLSNRDASLETLNAWLEQDIPSNHSPYFAPVLHPTIERGVEALVRGARTVLTRP